MSMEHFQEHFCELHICSPSPNFLDDSNCSWTSSTQEGRWVAGVTAGGCTDHTETFWTNPQYLVTVANGPQYTEEQGTPNMLVSVIQKSDKKHRHLATMYRIGFYVFEVPPEFQNRKQQFLASFFNAHAPVTRAFICARGVSKFFCLRSGQYVIVPSTINPNEASGFILKIFSKFNLSVEECCGQPELDVRTLSHSQSYEPENIKNVFSQYRDQYMEINAEKLQKLLNENIIKAQTEGFALDTCRSIVAMMDLSTTGTLDNKEFERLWRKVLIHRDIFLKFDESRSGRLPLSKLWKALQMRGTTVDHTLIHLITSRYSNSFGEISLESFIFLQLRLDYINKTFHMLSKGDGMHLQKKEWQNLAIYS